MRTKILYKTAILLKIFLFAAQGNIYSAELNLLQVTEFGKIPLSAIGYPKLNKLLYYRVVTNHEYFGLLIYADNKPIKSCLLTIPKGQSYSYEALKKLIKSDDCRDLAASQVDAASRTEITNRKMEICSEIEATPACEMKETLQFDRANRLISRSNISYDIRQGSVAGLYHGFQTDFHYKDNMLQELILINVKKPKKVINQFQLKYTNGVCSEILVGKRFKVYIRFENHKKALIESFDSKKSGFVEYYYEILP